MHPTRIFNTLIVLILLFSALAPAPVRAEELPPPEQATPTGVIARLTTVDANPDVPGPQMAPSLAAGPASLVGANLILNGDAEADPPGRPVTGWHGGANDFIVAGSYGDAGYPQTTDAGPSARGARFFHASKLYWNINAWQTVDLSAIGSIIDTQELPFTMSGYFGGLGATDDRALLRVYFNDARGVKVPGSTNLVIGDVSAAERQFKTGLVERSAQGVIPKGTRKLDFQLQMLNSTRTNPDALADNLSFTIHPLKTFVPSITNGKSNPAPLKTAPAAPSAFAVTGATTTSITLAWKDNAVDEQGFKLERANTGSATYTPVAYLLANTTGYVDSGLTPNTGYTYRLSAFNAAGSSAMVSVTRATLQTQAKPAAPASCWMSNTSSTSTMFSWTDSSNNEDYFSLYIYTFSGDFRHLADVAANSTMVTIVDLTPDLDFVLRVVAHNAMGNSAACDAHGKTLPDSASPSGFEVLNSASYPIVYLAIDGVNQFPVYPMGLMPGASYAMDLAPGYHTYEITTGFWQSKTSRFDMYTYAGDFDLPATGFSTLKVLDVTLAGILTQFSDTGMGYWEGYYYDANFNCRTAAFKFYHDNTYDFYVSNSKQAHGTYKLLSRSPSIYGLNFSAGTQEALLLEMYGEFYMKNGPPTWKQITYNYKPQGYIHNQLCP